MLNKAHGAEIKQLLDGRQTPQNESPLTLRRRVRSEETLEPRGVELDHSDRVVGDHEGKLGNPSWATDERIELCLWDAQPCDGGDQR